MSRAVYATAQQRQVGTALRAVREVASNRNFRVDAR